METGRTTYSERLRELFEFTRDSIELEHLYNPKEEALHPTLELEFDNHDDVFLIIEKIKEKGYFDDSQSAEFAIGLKMFSEVMLRNKDNPLFEDFRPAFKDFMMKLKEKKEENRK
ncbi:MAG: DUF3861 family protein [Pedobacter sp.]|nr:MAG: DUF3861 family protein [Pedobacter sp.]